MTLRLVALGGAAAWPNPGQGCSSYLIQSATASIVVDCGPDTLLELRRHVDFRSVDAILISHCHADHILDLVAYRYGLRYGPQQLVRNIPLWLPPGDNERLTMLANAFDGQGEPHDSFWDDVFSRAEYDPNRTLQIGDIAISFGATQHFIACYAMRFENPEGSVIAYSADTGNIEPLLPFFDRADLAIVEATLESYNGVPLEQRGHLIPEDAGRLAALSGATRLMLTHLWSERRDEEVIRAARRHFSGEIMIAKPGLRCDVGAI
jgi:ribonuclease BN (tRNA processing enzyme)